MGQAIHHPVRCLLAKDLERFEKCINDLIDPPLTQTQFDSLCRGASMSVLVRSRSRRFAAV